MKIACLGWGSLCWNEDGLPVAGDWNLDGPRLPLEFLRRSENGRVTLVLDADGAVVQSLWCLLDRYDLASAIEALRRREGVLTKNVERDIGRWPTGPTPALIPELPAWAQNHDLDAVVWTGLGFSSKAWPERQSADSIMAYLGSLTGETRKLAEEYVRKAPAQVRTVLRTRIETELGWTPLS